MTEITAASKLARKALFLFWVFLIYWFLTIIGISDIRIVFDKMVRLPIFELEIGLDLFFVLVPVIAIFIYAYSQLILHQVITLLKELEMNDYAIRKRYFHPLMLYPLEIPECGLFGLLQRLLNKLILWAPLPFVLIFNAFWYIRTHDRLLSYVVSSIAVLGTLIVLWFWKRNSFYWRRKSLIRTIVCWGIFSLMVVVETCLFIYFIPNAQEGIIPGKFGQSYLGRPLAHLVRVDLSHQKLVPEPAAEYRGHLWADFERARLEGADLRKTFLKRANLKGAHLLRTNMEYAVLEGADLRFADLRYTNLICAEAKGADFSGALMRVTFLRDANLQGACFRGATLLYARMSYADLRGAELALANLVEAILFDANLQGANLWEANLKGSDLIKADFLNANLKNSNLQGARFWKTNLQGANLEGAILLEAEGLDTAQLSKVETLYKAKLDPALYREVKNQFPHLLEKPKNEDKQI